MSQAERESLYETIKVFPGLKSRFNTMLDMLKCIVIEDSDSALTSAQSNNDKVDRKQQRPRTNHQSGYSGSSNSNNSLSTKGSNGVAMSRDSGSSRRITNQKSLNVLRSLNSNLNQSANFFKNYQVTNNKENQGEFDNDQVISMLENSNKNLNLEINKIRKEMEYYKKLSKL